MEVFIRSLLGEQSFSTIPNQQRPNYQIGRFQLIKGGASESLIAMQQLVQTNNQVRYLVDIARNGSVIDLSTEEYGYEARYGYILDGLGSVVGRIDAEGGTIEIPCEVDMSSVKRPESFYGRQDVQDVAEYQEMLQVSEPPRIIIRRNNAQRSKFKYAICDGRHRVVALEGARRMRVSAWLQLSYKDKTPIEILPGDQEEDYVNRFHRFLDAAGLTEMKRSVVLPPEQ